MLLGLAYQQRARETGDPTYYTKSGGALDRALALDRKDALAVSGLGSLALSRHRFARGARSSASGAIALSPDDGAQLRRHRRRRDRARPLPRTPSRDFDTMSRLRPNLSSYARVSYARELLGHTAERDHARCS